MSKTHKERFEPIVVAPGKAKRRIGVMPTRRELDRKKNPRREGKNRWERELVDGPAVYQAM